MMKGTPAITLTAEQYKQLLANSTRPIINSRGARRHLAAVVWLLRASGVKVKDLRADHALFGVSKTAMGRALEIASAFDREHCTAGHFSGGWFHDREHPIEALERGIELERSREKHREFVAARNLVTCDAHGDRSVWCFRLLDEQGVCVDHGRQYNLEDPEDARLFSIARLLVIERRAKGWQ